MNVLLKPELEKFLDDQVQSGRYDSVADAINEYNRNDILADPISVSLLLGFFGWVVAMLAAAVAVRRAGAGWPATLLLAGAALFAIHPPPIGPIGLACFAAAAVLIERWRARGAGALAFSRAAGGLAPSP